MACLDTYDPGDFYDELFQAKGTPRPAAAELVRRIQSLPLKELQRRQEAAQKKCSLSSG